MTRTVHTLSRTLAALALLLPAAACSLDNPFSEEDELVHTLEQSEEEAARDALIEAARTEVDAARSEHFALGATDVQGARQSMQERRKQTRATGRRAFGKRIPQRRR